MYLSGLVVGAVGDVLLQHVVNTDIASDATKKALIPYFESWTPIPSVVAASVFTGFWAKMFEMTGYGEEWFVPYALLLDEAYRMYHPILYPSLSDYYQSFTRNETLLFNGLTAVLINTVYRLM